MPRVIAEQDARLPVIGALVALAWLTLVVWAQSPYGRYLDHGDWLRVGLAGSICRALPAGSIVFPAFLYISGWVLMIVAMMLPTTLPLLAIFVRITRTKNNRSFLLSLVIAGYLTVWTLFGLVAHAADLGLSKAFAGNSFLTLNGWIVSVAVLAIAGLFQFSRLKYKCLDRCRTPFSFINEHWHGNAEGKQSFVLGMHHGLFCVGCCWAIMLLMFVVGTGSVGWMLAVGAIMAIEKNFRWGKRLSVPLGGSLLLASATVFAINV